jgi:hypothetical protein
MWVLIVSLYVVTPFNGNVTMHDFSSQEACEKARDLVLKPRAGGIRIEAVCTPK